jgi:hypothetical protein
MLDGRHFNFFGLPVSRRKFRKSELGFGTALVVAALLVIAH